MKDVLLSGVGGSTNWLPLIYPLFGLLLILFAADTTLKFIKRRRLKKQLRQQQEPEIQDIEHPEAINTAPNIHCLSVIVLGGWANNNWMPFLLPALVLLAVIYGATLLSRLRRRKAGGGINRPV